MEKLGGEYQRTDVEISSSSREARNKFLGLIELLAKEVFRDLLQPCRLESLPDDSKKDGRIHNCWMRFFLLHTKDPKWFREDTDKLGCAADVRDTPLLAYFDYIHKNEPRLNELTEESEAYLEGAVAKTSWCYDRLVAERTIKTFIPSWTALNSRPDSERLCKELSAWAERWNLQEDWCLNFALDCLGIIKNDYVEKFHPGEDYLKSSDQCWQYKQLWWYGKAWADARVENVSLEKVRTDFDHNNSLSAETTEKLEFKYVWPRSLRCDDQEAIRLREVLFPFGTRPYPQFIAAIEEEFWRQFFNYFEGKWTFCIGKTDEIACEIKRFQKELKAFVARTRTTLYKLENVEKTIAIKTDKHFRWLIDFQINRLEYRDIAENEGIDQKTIREGVYTASQLIDLRLRPSGRKPGRPVGSRTVSRGRGRTIQKLIRG